MTTMPNDEPADWIAISGNVCDGFVHHGPFASHTVAVEYAFALERAQLAAGDPPCTIIVAALDIDADVVEAMNHG